jgi:hypothetical protein
VFDSASMGRLDKMACRPDDSFLVDDIGDPIREQPIGSGERIRALEKLFSSPFSVELGDGRADREAPR